MTTDHDDNEPDLARWLEELGRRKLKPNPAEVLPAQDSLKTPEPMHSIISLPGLVVFVAG